MPRSAPLLRWKVEFLDRFTGALPNVQGQDSWKFLLTYLVPPLLYCLPFSLSLPGAIWRAIRPGPGVNRNGVRFLLLWFVGLFAFFTASTGKEWRYFLPALPPLFVLLGIELAAFFSPQRPPHVRMELWFARGIWIVTPLLLAAGVLGVQKWHGLRGAAEVDGLYTLGDVLAAYAVACLVLYAGIALATYLYIRRCESASFGTLVVMMWAAWAWIWPVMLPMIASQRPFVEFARTLRDPAVLPADLRPIVRNVGTHDSRIIWYSDLRPPRVIDQFQLLDEQHGRRDLGYEERRTGEEMVNALERPAPALFLASLPDYLLFLIKAPEELEKVGRKLPAVHLWAQSRYGLPDTQFVLFSNRPPPGPEPVLALPSKLRANLSKKGYVLPVPTTTPAVPGAISATQEVRPSAPPASLPAAVLESRP